MRKRILAGLLTVLMCVTSINMPAFAVDGSMVESLTETVAETEVSEETIVETEVETDVSEEVTAETVAETEVSEETIVETEEETGVFEETTEETTVETEAETDVSEETTVEDEEVTVEMVSGNEIVGQPELITEMVDGSDRVFQAGGLAIPEEPEIPTGMTTFETANKKEAASYIYSQLQKKASSINVSTYNISTSDIGSVYFGVLNDHPDLFYVKSEVRYSYYSTSCVVNLTPTYISGLNESAFKTAVADALSFVDSDMTDIEKAIVLHDYLVLNCEYEQGKITDQSYSPYGVFVTGRAVCQGYALAYKLLMDRVGIECYMVSSDSMNHAWNVIKLDGSYYQIDVTWDDPVPDMFGRPAHSYMFCSDSWFKNPSGGETNHYGWVITKGSDNVTSKVKATNTKYDDEYWKNIYSPMILEDDECFYLYGEKLLVRNLQTETVTTLCEIESFNYETLKGSTLGMFEIGDRIFYNDFERIYSISKDGGDPRAETNSLLLENTSIAGCALIKGKAKYILFNSVTGKRTSHVAEFLNDVQIPVNKLTLSKKSVTLNPGKTQQLTATILPSYAKQNEILWESSDPAVATVENGLITGIKGGTCKVTATSGGKSAVCDVTIRTKLSKPVSDSLVKEDGTATIDKGATVTLTTDHGATIFYTTNGKNPTGKATSTNKKYTGPITINKDLTLKAIAIAPSDAYINSDITTIKYKACTNNIVFEKSELTITERKTQEIVVTEVPTTKTKEEIIWTSKNPEVATVDESGVVTAVYEGETEIVATTQDHAGRTVSTSCFVTVVPPIYTVTFMGLATKPIKVVQVYARRGVINPQVPKVEGYEFTGWDKSFNYITKDTVVQAQYELEKYSITYVDNGGVNSKDNPIEYTIETPSITLQPATEKAGYDFVGWYTDENFETERVSVIEKGTTGNLTLYAKWRDARGLWMDKIPNQDYTRKAVKPDFVVYYGADPLVKGTDYTVSYKNNVAATESLSEENKILKAPTVIIKGKGNYTGTLKENFYIEQKNIEDNDVTVNDLILENKKNTVMNPVPVVMWNGKKLSHKKDFTLEYPEKEDGAYVLPGSYRILVHGCGNYTGTREAYLTITNLENDILFSKVKISKIPNQVYKPGESVVLTENMPKVTYKGEQLKLGRDYRLLYGNYSEVGTYTVTVQGLDDGVGQDFVGEKNVQFKIVGTPISKWKVSKLSPRTYTGEKITFNPNAPEGTEAYVAITDAQGNPMKEGRDYKLDYQNNEKAGNAKLIITGINQYSGTLKKTFKITAASVKAENADVQVSFANGENTCEYLKGGAKPNVVVTFKGKELSLGKDYTVSYKNNNSVIPKFNKEPVLTIKGKGNFKDSREIPFTIAKKDIAKVTISVNDIVANTKAGKYMSKPVLTDVNGKKLTAGVDYEKAYIYRDKNKTVLDKYDTPKAGDVLTVTVIGKGNYSGEISAKFHINEKGKSLSSAKVTVNKEPIYNGEKITLSKDDLVVKIGKNTLTADDYEIIQYKNNLKKGTATVILRGKGLYGGTKKFTFKIKAYTMKWDVQ